MPQIVGPWLAGAYDNDQTVCRAARESLSKVFNPTEKLKKVWEVFHATTLEYQTNVIMNETIHTLSDERQTTSDDAEAKYARVIAASISSVRHLLCKSSPRNVQ